MSDIYRPATVLRANSFRSVKWDNRLGKSSCCADVGWNFPGRSSYAIFCAWFCISCSGGGLFCWMAKLQSKQTPCWGNIGAFGIHWSLSPRLVPSVPGSDGSLEVKHPESSLPSEQALCCASFQPSWTRKWSQSNCRRWPRVLEWLFLSSPEHCQAINHLLQGYCLLKPSKISFLCFSYLHRALDW